MNIRTLPIKISIVIIITILLTGNILSQSNPLKNKFSFGIVSELLRNWKYQNSFHFGKYDSLKLDVIQSYSNRGNNDRSDERCFGGFYDSLIHYINVVRSSIDTTNTLKVFERAKIVRPAYGQRSTYQAEYPTYTFPRYYSSELCFISQKEFLCFRN